MLSDSFIILKKELRRIFTDRRTLAMLVLLPLLMLPVMYSVMAKMGASRDSDITSFRSTICIYEGIGNETVMGPFIEAISSLNTELEIVQLSEYMKAWPGAALSILVSISIPPQITHSTLTAGSVKLWLRSMEI